MAGGFESIVFFNDGFDWPLKSNRYWMPLIWSRKTKVLSVEYPSFSRTIRQFLKISKLPVLEKKGSGLYIYRSLAILPFNREFSLSEKANQLFNYLILKFFLLHHLNLKRPILWFFYPQAYSLMNKINHQLSIYHIVDVLSEYSFFYKNEAKKKWFERVEKKMANKIDLIFATSPLLYQKMRKINKKTFLVGNASNTIFLIEQAKEKIRPPKDLKEIKRPIIGFIGGIDNYRFDFNLLGYLAHNLPKASFAVIGPVGKAKDMVKEDLPQEKNIFYLGMKNFQKLPAYLVNFDTCLFLYPQNKYTRGVTPITLFDYFAFGKPVVSLKLSSLKDYQEWLYLANDKEGFLKQLKIALEERDGGKKKRRIGLAKNHSWESLVKKMEKIILLELAP